jgi:AraC-like DNA-binding protein
MLTPTEVFARTTERTGTHGVIDDTLRSLRITGSLLLRESYAAPWAVAIPDSQAVSRLLGLAAGVRAVAFHLVEFGHCEIVYGGADPVLLKAGDMAVCFGGAAHRIAAGKRPQTQAIASLLSGGINTQRPDGKGHAPTTSLLCGVFLLRHVELNPLLAALPGMVHSTLARTGALHNLSGVARLLSDEMERASHGSGYVIERLVEVLCAEAVRAHIEAAPGGDVGWFRGIKDPVVGRAIAAIHTRPGEDWSVQRLAREVSMSPSRFAARFSESLGDSPMAYVASWRMNVACRKLATSGLAIDQIAADVGYESHAAFNRAFKKLVGLPPAAWRARQRQ